mgnify:CR=1 FL=1
MRKSNKNIALYLLLIVGLWAFCFVTLKLLLMPYSIAYTESGKMTIGYFCYAAIGLLFSTPAPFISVLIIALFAIAVGIVAAIIFAMKIVKPISRLEKVVKNISEENNKELLLRNEIKNLPAVFITLVVQAYICFPVLDKGINSAVIVRSHKKGLPLLFKFGKFGNRKVNYSRIVA